MWCRYKVALRYACVCVRSAYCCRKTPSRTSCKCTAARLQHVTVDQATQCCCSMSTAGAHFAVIWSTCSSLQTSMNSSDESNQSSHCNANISVQHKRRGYLCECARAPPGVARFRRACRRTSSATRPSHSSAQHKTMGQKLNAFENKHHRKIVLRNPTRKMIVSPRCVSCSCGE